MKLRTIEEVRAEFQASGISISQWAIANGFSPNSVYHILMGRRQGLRGQSHDIAVKLGIKNGEIRTGPVATVLDRSRRRHAATATAGV
ncbi:DNA-binding protein [Castellaniella caeni]|uniref:DNA-binding protein n=1 Tax=Castellaniella caeni TaxID=266123 RepID=UPI000C9F684E|nr:DNA-binding protein [Castellaniella caeni]